MEEEKFSEYDSESCEISYFALCYPGGIELFTNHGVCKIKFVVV